jgi:hypothetical protein
MFFKQISGHKYMFLDYEKNLCKMNSEGEILFYEKMCPPLLRQWVPEYKGTFLLREGIDKLDLDEEFDIERYCPTRSEISKNSS